jgi:hypothetical protein
VVSIFARAPGLVCGLGLVVATIASACSLLPCVERRHASGLLLVCREQMRTMPEPFSAASAFSWDLAEAHPDEFGYPWADRETGTVELRVTGTSAAPFVSEWLAGNATRGSGNKTLPLSRPEVPIRQVTVDRSFRQLEAIKHGAVPPKDLPDGELIYMTAPDGRHNAVMIGIDRMSDRLISALAARYGTSAIVILVEPNAFRTGY